MYKQLHLHKILFFPILSLYGIQDLQIFYHYFTNYTAH